MADKPHGLSGVGDKVKSRIRRLRELSLRDLFWAVLPLLVIVIAGFWAASRFIKPAPPDTFVLASGGEGGAYQRFASAYRDVLARYGIELVEKTSAGAMENLRNLRDANIGADAGFYQGGLSRPTADDELVSLGGLYYEPLWVFYREGVGGRRGPDRLTQLKGRRIAVGAVGTGTRHLALELLNANGINEGNARLIEIGGLGLGDAFASGRIDAALVVGPTQSATVWSLLFAPGVRLMDMAHAEAYSRRYPYLSKVTLPKGAVDLERNVPRQDTTLVAAMATLLVREDIHPALVDLLLQAAAEVHGGGSVFNKSGEFPKATGVDFPLAPEAERYYKSGKPFLQRYLPFWAATLIDRLVVLLIPVFALLIPLMKVAPGLYSWRIRSRIYRRYGELKFLESELDAAPDQHTRAEWLARIEIIEKDVNGIPTPLAYADMLYTLRGHIDLVRAALLKKTSA